MLLANFKPETIQTLNKKEDMTNNDIFKKLRVALQLRDDEIVDILQLVDFRISKAELGAFFRSEDHPNYKECGDQILRNFLNGLVIHLRGTKENPKNPKEVLAQKKAQLKEAKPEVKEPKKDKKTTSEDKPAKKFAPKKEIKKPPFGKVKFNNGKKKKD